MKSANILLIFIILLVPMTGFAAGQHIPGSILIEKTPFTTSLWADVNVRWNTGSSGGGYVLMNGYANDRVFISARDRDGQIFSCVIEVNSPYYEQSVDVKNNLTVGGSLFVSKTNSTNTCSGFSFGKYSSLQN